jgi:hypothetical protein
MILTQDAFSFVEEDPLEVHFQRLRIGGLHQSRFLADALRFDQIE